MLTLHPGPGKPVGLPPAGTKHVVRSETTVLSTRATEAKWLHLSQAVGEGSRRYVTALGAHWHGSQESRFEPRLRHLEDV